MARSYPLVAAMVERAEQTSTSARENTTEGRNAQRRAQALPAEARSIASHSDVSVLACACAPSRRRKGLMRLAAVPAVTDANETELARGALDDKGLLDVVEQPYTFGVERVRAHDVFARQQRQLRKRQ